MSKHYNIPIFVPHAGCPHDCVFCNQKKITGLLKPLEIDAVKDLIDTYLKTIQNNDDAKDIEIAFFGGSFTGIPVQEQVELLSLAYTYKCSGLIDGIRLSTRPDYIDMTVLKRLKEYGVTTIELGIQSLEPVVLLASKRGHTSEHMTIASKLIKAEGFNLGLQMMIGLPGDSKDTMLKTAKSICDAEPDFVRIYPTLVIEDTELAVLYDNKLYQAMTIKDAVEYSALLLDLFDSRSIEVIRLGLHPTDDLSAGGVIAGPYHPAFRQLVESYRIKLKMETVLNACGSIEQVEIKTHPKNISNVVGQKRNNLLHFEEKYQLKRIKVYPTEQLLECMELIVNSKIYTINLGYQLI